MVQPYDYRLNVPSPIEAFSQGMQIGAARRQIEQKRAAQQRQADMQRDMQTLLSGNPSPQALADFYLRYPEAKESIDAYQKTLSDADKNTILNVGQEAFLLNRAGKPEEVLSLFDVRIQAAENAGRPDLADTFRRSRRMYELTPDQETREGIIATAIYGAGGGEAYEKVWGVRTDVTSFQKDLKAAGIDPQSPEGVAKAREYVDLKIDPIVEMPTPTGGTFVGRQSEYYRLFGGGAPAPTPKGIPSVGEVRNGWRFNGGDPSKKENWSKAKGDTIENTPAPQLMENGIPAVLTRAQYNATVQAMGKAQTDDWMRRNNVRLVEK